MQMIPYCELEHTADVGLEIYGNSLEELFTNSIKGLFHLISPGLKVMKEIPFLPKGQTSIVELDARTREELFVYWLNEFIYNFFVKGVYPEIVKIAELSKDGIRAEVHFRKFTETEKINLEIKAATYHQLYIKKSNDRYQARVIFDV